MDKQFNERWKLKSANTSDFFEIRQIPVRRIILLQANTPSYLSPSSRQLFKETR